MNKILVGIPVLFNGDTCLRVFESVIGEADLLIVDNGANKDVKDAIYLTRIKYPSVKAIRNDKNEYVNSGWNQILKYFLDSDYEQLIILNSDLILLQGWSKYIIDGISAIPHEDKRDCDEEVFEGTPGVMIHLNREMAELVYPIPESIKIWFGDLWIYSKIRKAGYKTIVKAGLKALHFHGGSQTCNKLPEFQEIIEQDKIAWLEIEKTL